MSDEPLIEGTAEAIAEHRRRLLNAFAIPRNALPEWAADARLPRPAGAVDMAYRALILAAERDAADREGLADTPKRAARAFAELTSGYGEPPELTTFSSETDQIITQAGVPFHSLCEHHILPFFGTIDFAYIPSDRIIGLSKFSRITDHFSRRLQVQERMTEQIADHLEKVLDPRALMVIATGEHLCMSMRGVQRLGAKTKTSVARGGFRENQAARGEALELLR